jgi:ribosomal protein S16
LFIVKLKPIYIKIKKYIIFQIEVHKKLAKGSTAFVEKIGFYNSDPFKKIISIKGDRLGF